MADLLDKLAPPPGPKKHSPESLLRVAGKKGRPVKYKPPEDMPPEVAKYLSELYPDRNIVRELILALTANGAELVMHALEEMRGDRRYLVADKFGEPMEIGPSAQDEDRAREFLAKYGLPPPPKELRITGRDGGPVEVATSVEDYSMYTPDELREMARITAGALQRRTVVDPGPTVDGEVSK